MLSIHAVLNGRKWKLDCNLKVWRIVQIHHMTVGEEIRSSHPLPRQLAAWLLCWCVFRERYWTVNCRWKLFEQCMGVMYVWMCEQMGECGKYCKGLEAINKTSKVLYKCDPFTIYITHMQVQPSMHDINKVMTHLAIKVKHTAGYRNSFIE